MVFFILIREIVFIFYCCNIILFFYRYRGSTDDLRRSREDISVPSLIPKLLPFRGKEERLKRQDSKDDIRHSVKPARKDPREEAKSPLFVATPLTPTSKDEAGKSGLRIFRRDNSREDSVGSANSIKESAKGTKQERAAESVGGSTAKSKVTGGEQNRIKCEEHKECAANNDPEESTSSRIVETTVPVEGRQEAVILDPQENEKRPDVESQDDARMIDVIVVGNRTQVERTSREQNAMVAGEEQMTDEKQQQHSLAIQEPSVETVASENDNSEGRLERDTCVAERSLDVSSSDGDVVGVVAEKKGSLEFGYYEKRSDEFQVVSEFLSFVIVISSRIDKNVGTFFV